MKRKIIMFITACVLSAALLSGFMSSAVFGAGTPVAASRLNMPVPQAPGNLTDIKGWNSAYREYIKNYDEARALLPEPSPAPTLSPIPHDSLPAVVDARFQGIFRDVPGHWAEAAIMYCYDQGYINIFPDATVRPDLAITRAELAYSLDKWIAANWDLLQRMEFTPAQTPGSPVFSDTPSSHEFYLNIMSVASMGIMAADSTVFMPNYGLTRQDVCEIWVRLFKMLKNSTMDDAYFSNLDIDAILENYPDSAGITDGSAREAVAAMIDRQLMHIYTDGSLKPHDMLTRAEAYTILAAIDLNLRHSIKQNRSLADSYVAYGIQLLRANARNVSRRGFELEIAVNDIAINRNAEVVVSYAQDFDFAVTKENIATSPALVTAIWRLSDMVSENNSLYEGVYSAYVNADISRDIYVYVMLRSDNEHSDIRSFALHSYDDVTAWPAEPSPTPAASPTPTPSPTPAPAELIKAALGEDNVNIINTTSGVAIDVIKSTTVSRDFVIPENTRVDIKATGVTVTLPGINKITITSGGALEVSASAVLRLPAGSAIIVQSGGAFNNWGIETSSNIRPDPGARLVVYPGAILTNIWSRNLLTGAA
ncbi:MAG: S-layer homology domain-containing protein, partial [Clostridiales bacterium]|nr:S-layer homology domain-containing protein [Clostridiales bacterium]